MDNKKRIRTTPEQLALLEDTFKTNPSPNSKIREAIAEKLNMSERSIQVWFQNRRAKMKTMQKRTYLIISNNDKISVSQHQPQSQQFTLPEEFITLSFNINNNTSLVSLISCEYLTIGTWHCILTMSSLCYYTLPQNILTYHITNENIEFKMEFSLSDVFSVEYQPIDNIYSQIIIEVKESPSFYMKSNYSEWNTCKDFTEDKQASRHMIHILKGCSILIKPQLIKLMQDDPNLAKVVTIFETPALADH
ncbi:uncharacterized protein OCT59_025992 [Rhizophagus irregularis]|uniref:Homeobox domain-containing protein n=6 Tax=Rhizophagus irregularis TaxID=588596 RepID=A0A916E1Z1_9GLOM|nr:Pho2p [Rhizophagus irregularis DAOM 197198w]UZO05648.1 hypothetical protein OCT59_025992 [Rhizophagus irregularis]GBC12298.1 homeobox domain-containing protein [Rhizophagus irregularis DAOM 181602=DAOM 197198]CAB4478883.1 unnamed protein product [Rhizophagus irregularis]CAB5108685.1 unnamed protein product [Rhizophagus irregularis]